MVIYIKKTFNKLYTCISFAQKAGIMCSINSGNTAAASCSTSGARVSFIYRNKLTRWVSQEAEFTEFSLFFRVREGFAESSTEQVKC